MWKNLKNQKGFLLIESFVAVFILSIGIVAAVGMFNVSAHSARANADQIVAMNLARGQSEFLQTGHMDYINKIGATNANIWLDSNLKPMSDGVVVINNRAFTINTVLSKDPLGGALTKATVTVSWVDSRKKNKETTFVSWFFPLPTN